MEGTPLQEACDAIGRNVIIKLAQEMTSARRKHPVFAVDHEEAVDVVESEFLEFKAQAMRAGKLASRLDEDKRARAESEAWHVAVTALRYVGREYC